MPYLKELENPIVIGQHIRKRRLRLGLRQSEVAKILDVCEDTITGWEKARRTPMVAHFPKIIAFLGYNPLALQSDTIGGRIKQYRVENGLSQEQFAKLVNVDESSVWSWEVEKHSPHPSKLKQLEQVLNQKEPS